MPARRGDRPNATDAAIATTSMARSTDVEIEIDPAHRDRSVRSNLDASIERSSNRAIDPGIAVGADVTPGGTARRTTP